MFNIGFTGTQRGMTSPQKYSVYCFVKSQINFLYGMLIHHGDCIGADEDFHYICKEIREEHHYTPLSFVIHPPIIEKKRAFCSIDPGRDKILDPKDYMIRNQDIVNVSDILIATPGEHNEVLRSGTWSTIRKARKKNKKIFIVYPDGTTSSQSDT